MSTKKKIPLFQVVYFGILCLLIVFRFFFYDFSLHINLVNYISMAVAVSLVFYSSIMYIQDKRRKNICKSIVVGLILILALIGCSILICKIKISSIINDIFTIIALMCCLSQQVCEWILLKIMSIGLEE